MIVFSEEELKAIETFEKEHLNCNHKPDAKSKITEFVIRQDFGTGIGFSTHIKCSCCGEEKDITDYNCW